MHPSKVNHIFCQTNVFVIQYHDYEICVFLLLNSISMTYQKFYHLHVLIALNVYTGVITGMHLL